MRRVFISLAVLLALFTAACGGDDTGASSAEGTEQGAGGESAYPVSIEHRHGETTIEARPERVVSLNVQWTDALISLGVEPAGYVLDAGSLETEPYPWQVGKLGDAERIDVNGTVPYEAIAALEPDLILASFVAEDEAVFDKLSAIAPTIGLLGDLQVDPWDDMVEALGDALQEQDAADAVIAAVDGKVAALAEAMPELEGKTYVLANYVPGDAIYIVADPDDGAGRLFADLGMAIAPAVLALDEAAVGRVQISLEQAGLLDSDVLVVFANGGDPADLVGWEGLTSVETGAVVDFSFADVVGINTPTPLSIPYALDLLRPALEAAAAAAPADG